MDRAYKLWLDALVLGRSGGRGLVEMIIAEGADIAYRSGTATAEGIREEIALVDAAFDATRVPPSA